MKKASFLALCLGLALATVMSAQAPNANGTARKKRVAVFDFDYATVHQVLGTRSSAATSTWAGASATCS